MDLEYIKNLPSFKLVRSDNFAFFLGFFYYAFQNDRLSHTDIETKLDDYMFDNDFGIKHPKEYIEDMVKAGYLKRFFEKDELYYELTKDVYKVMEFVDSLQKKEFVGSETKFSILLELLEKLNFETLPKEEKIKALEERIKSIQKEIKRLQKEEVVTDERRVKELISEFINISKRLLFDFSEIEESFLSLNRRTKEKIIQSVKKSDVLEFVFDNEEKIKNSDEGKSFMAFWQMLESKKSEEMDEIIDKIIQIAELSEAETNALLNFKNDLRKGGYKILSLINRLIEQLRVFIDDKLYIEHKRVKELIESLSSKIIKGAVFEQTELENLKFDISFPFEREFFEVKKEETFDVKLKEVEIDENMEFLCEFVDEMKIKENILNYLKTRKKAFLSEILKFYGVKNIAEIAGYVFMFEKLNAVLLNQKEVYIADEYRVTLPKIIFYKDENV
jgi:hypothetical protein